MNIGHVIKNAAMLFFSHVLVRLLTAGATIMLARYFDAEEYGILSLTISFAAVASFFSELGFTHTLMREGTKPNADIKSVMSSYFKTRIVAAIITLFISVLTIETLYSENRIVLYWAVIPTVIGAVFIGMGVSYYQVTQQMKYTAYIRAVTGTLTALALFSAIYMNAELIWVTAIYGMSSIIGGILSTGLVIKKVNFIRGWNKNLLAGAGAFALSGFVAMIMPQVGTLVLEKVASLKEVGHYSAASRVPSLLYQIPAVLALAFYPLLFKYAGNKEMDSHRALNTMQMKFMSITGVIICLPFIVSSEWWMTFLFGNEYASAYLVLSILSYIVILQSVNATLSDSLATQGFHKRRSIAQVIIFSMSVLIFVILGSQYGAVGCAAAALFSEVVTLIVFMTINPNGWKLVSQGARTAVIAFVSSLIFAFILSEADTTPAIRIVLVPLIYLAIIVLVDKQLLEFIKKRKGNLFHKKSISKKANEI